MSASPGESHPPAQSMRRAPAGTGVEADGPTATMRPSETTTVWSRSTRSESMGATLAWTNAVAPLPAGPAAAPGDGVPGAKPARRTVARRTTRSAARGPARREENVFMT